jgi:hypothetical protein
MNEAVRQRFTVNPNSLAGAAIIVNGLWAMTVLMLFLAEEPQD